MTKRTVSETDLKDKAYLIALDPDGYKRELASIFYKFFDKIIASGTKASVKITQTSN